MSDKAKAARDFLHLAARDFNPYHDARGRFTSNGSATSFTLKTRNAAKQGLADKAVNREKDKQRVDGLRKDALAARKKMSRVQANITKAQRERLTAKSPEDKAKWDDRIKKYSNEWDSLNKVVQEAWYEGLKMANYSEPDFEEMPF